MNENKTTESAAKEDNEIHLATVRERVRERLHATHKSQRELEDAAGYSAGYVSRLLSGDRPLKASHIRVIAATLDKFGGAVAGQSTDETLVAGTLYSAVLKVGDDAPTDVLFASLVEELDEQRSRVGELEASKGTAEKRATEAEQQVAALYEKLAVAEKRATEAEIQSKYDGERVVRAETALEHERRSRVAAEESVARLRAKVELPVAASAEDRQYVAALRRSGVTDWMSYARLLERQRNDLLAKLAKERGRPGWGTAAVAFLAGVGTAAVASAGGKDEADR